MDNDMIRQQIEELLLSQELAVLATQRGGQPYCTLMAFALAGSIDNLLIATPAGTRKYENLLESPHVSLLIDDRSASPDVFRQARVVTALGEARETKEDETLWSRKQLLERHPDLAAFFAAPATRFFIITVRHYVLVNRFQKVFDLHMAE